MFAFAVWDAPRRPALPGARPHGPEAPYYAVAGGAGAGPTAVACASELLALLEVPWVGRTVDPAKVVEYLRFGYIDRGRSTPASRPSLHRLRLSLAPMSGTRSFEGISHANAVDPADPVNLDAGPAETARRLVLAAVRRQSCRMCRWGVFFPVGSTVRSSAAAMRAAVPPSPAGDDLYHRFR